MLLACKTSVKIYNLQLGACICTHSPTADILSTYLDLESFNIFHSTKFLTFSPHIAVDRTISSDEADAPDRSRSLSNVGVSSGEDASEKTYVTVHRKTLDRKSSRSAKRRVKTSGAEGEDSDPTSSSAISGSLPESAGEMQVKLLVSPPRISRTSSRSPTASRSLSDITFIKAKGVEQESSESSASEKTPIYVSGIKTSHVIKFGVPDSEENIVYSEKTVKTGTFSKLVEKLTASSAEIGKPLTIYASDPAVDIDGFLLTYRAFSTPNDLLVALFLRYNSAPPEEEKAVRLR